MTALQIFGTTYAFILGFLPSTLLIVFRQQIVEVNRRRAEKLAGRYPSLGHRYRQTAGELTGSHFVVVAVIWAAVFVTSFGMATVGAFN